MKNLITLTLVVSLVLSPTFVVFAGGNGNSSGNGRDKQVKNENTEEVQAVSQSDTGLADDLDEETQISTQKVFKGELNEQKKQISESIGTLEEQKAALEAQYNELLSAGSTAEAEALLTSISGLDTQIQDLQSQKKAIINERFMIAKSSYTEEELAQFDSAAALIEKLYADAETLAAGSITINNNLIKLDGPAYLKGGRTIIPVRAITEGLGAAVTWDPETKSVTITKDGIEITLTVNSTTALVNGAEQPIDVPAEITNSSTYVPLRFIAETLGLTTTWDDETNIIDIEDTAELDQETSGSAIEVQTTPAESTAVSDSAIDTQK